jgi:hypothetical protein
MSDKCRNEKALHRIMAISNVGEGDKNENNE